jgi:hypothetical protein
VSLSRKDALDQGLPRYFTGNPCKHGHVAERYTGNKTCCECANATANATKSKNRQKYSDSSNDWRKNNLDKSTAYSRKYVTQNKGKRNLWTSIYRQSKDDRMPEWLDPIDLLEMESIYAYCSALRKCGLDYHVDHIVPLRGTIVSGLHVPWNLQVIPGRENMSKGNKYGV